MPGSRRWFFEAGGGWCGVAWSEGGILALSLPATSREAAEGHLAGAAPGAVDASPDGTARDLAARVGRFLSGAEEDFDGVGLDLSGMAPFRRRVMETVRRIPRGQVRTYGQVAADAGSPGAARAVGGCMARNPVPLVVPCHRVVGSGGAMVGFSAPGGIDSKRRLLDMERGRAGSGPPRPGKVTGE